MMKCPSCGLSNFAEAETCRRCGSSTRTSGTPKAVGEANARCSHCGLKRPADVETCPFCDGGRGPGFRGFGPDPDGDDGQARKPWRGHVTLVLGLIVLIGGGAAVGLMSAAGARLPAGLYIVFIAGIGLLIRGIRGQQPPGW